MVVIVGVDDFLKFLFFGLKFLVVVFFFPAGFLTFVFLIFIHLKQPLEISFLIGESLYFRRFGLNIVFYRVKFEQARLKFFTE